jgi:hypothetical protein
VRQLKSGNHTGGLLPRVTNTSDQAKAPVPPTARQSSQKGPSSVDRETVATHYLQVLENGEAHVRVQEQSVLQWAHITFINRRKSGARPLILEIRHSVRIRK